MIQRKPTRIELKSQDKDEYFSTRKAEETAKERAQWPGVGTEKTQQTVAQRIGLVGQDSATAARTD